MLAVVDLGSDQPLSRNQRPTEALTPWVVAWRHHNSLASGRGAVYLLRRDASAVGTLFGTMGLMRPVLHYLWRAWPSTFSSVLLIANDKWLEKKLLRSLPCCVACCEGCEPRCSRVVSVFLCLCVFVFLCFCAFVFTSRRVCLGRFPLSEVDVRHNDDTNSRCQRYYGEHHARLVLALPWRRASPLPFIEGKHEGSSADPSSRLQFSAFTRLCLPLPHASYSQSQQRQQHRSTS